MIIRFGCHAWVALCMAASFATAASAALAPAPSLYMLQDALHRHRFVDLTHSFAPGIPHFPGFPDEKTETINTIAKDGFTAQIFTHAGQWGTHVDPPAHFHAGLHTVDQISPADFLLKLVVLDIHAQAAARPDYQVTMQDVAGWEKRHGPIPAGAFVALRSDWAKRWPNAAAMSNNDAKGVSHYPGWSMPVLKFLLERRHVTAIGHETTDTDPGFRAYANDFSLESYVLGTNHFQIEMLANLNQVPEAGALIIVAFPKPENGTGFPARAVAILP